MTSQDASLDTPARKPRFLRRFTFRRLLMGGASLDLSRLPRYLWIFALGSAAIWAPITGYLKSAPLRYSSQMSLILPGSGASATVNLADIGQASSYSNSAFASNSISPTETYKRLLAADRVIRDAAGRLGVDPRGFGEPRVRLVDQTAFIHIEMVGPSPEEAQARNGALMDAFFTEIDRLRGDELDSRQNGGLAAMEEYQNSVAATRSDIAGLQAESGLHSAEQYRRQVQELDDLKAEIETLSTEHKSKEAAVRRLELQLDTGPTEASTILRLNGDSTYLALLDAIAEASAELADVRSRYGRQHPEVVKAAATLDAASSKAEARAVELTGQGMRLERAIDGGRATLLTELVRQDAERAGIAAELSELQTLRRTESARLDALAPLAAQLEDLQRDFSVAEAVFASAIARTQSSKTDIYASYPLVQVLEDPTLPDRPSSPNRKLALAAGVAACMLLVFSLCLAWIRGALIRGLLSVKGQGQ
ncbi:hypothetical protein HC022_03455 [Salipiger sp. HF18]|uniref:GumC family protein n=1 Tax=Salipiger sp. HF18 TaxID=2721557 RepID=UPI00142D9599|nr:hypothetical protein [Salipiger sp. HF18]NIY95335.1 hypothetical protein [Salipiger sp. HF18]